MKQQSLTGAWQRGAKYPVVITKLIHSFLPNAEILFIEQRLRYLKEAPKLVQTDDYTETINQWNNSHKLHVYLFCTQGDFGQTVELGVDLSKSVVTSQRVFNTILGRFWEFKYPTPSMSVPVPFFFQVSTRSENDNL